MKAIPFLFALLLPSISHARESMVTVSVARLPMPAGKKITWDDLTTVDLPEALLAPTTVVKGTELVGRVLAHPVAQQAPIVGQRLEGWVPPPAPPTEEQAVATIDWDLGPMGALVQAGDEVLWVHTGPGACRLARGALVVRGAPATFEMSTADAQRLQASSRAVAMLRGAGAAEGGLAPCEVAP